MKKIICFTLSIIMVLSICGGVAASNNTLATFKGINGDNINVSSLDKQPVFPKKTPNELSRRSNSDTVKIGDTIINNGVEEIVFAIAEDGSYVTIKNEQ